jgi:putative addiction module component (TIGR02574 family)
MAPSLQSLGIDQLSVADRIDLVTDIWQSIASELPTPQLSELQKAELEQRLADHSATPDDVISWEQIKAEALIRTQR